MRSLYHAGRTAVLGSLLVLALVVGVSAPAWAVDVAVSACGDFSVSNPNDSRFTLVNSITTTASTGVCLKFPANAVVNMSGFAVIGSNIDNNTTGIALGNNSFLWGPGIVRGFGLCVGASDHVGIEGILTNWCALGILAGDSAKIKEVRVHDCVPSSLNGIGILLSRGAESTGQGGFIESSIVRNCDTGVLTGENNKIWNLVVTNHEFVGLQVHTGSAVSRTVISHPRSTGTIGLQYFCEEEVGGGCQDGSNSVDGHAPGNNIQVFGNVVTQPQEDPTHGATNCSGVPVLRTHATGIINTSC